MKSKANRPIGLNRFKIETHQNFVRFGFLTHVLSRQKRVTKLTLRGYQLRGYVLRA